MNDIANWIFKKAREFEVTNHLTQFEDFKPEHFIENISHELVGQNPLDAVADPESPVIVTITLPTGKSLSKPNSEFWMGNLKKQITASGDYKQKIAVIPFTNLNKDEDGAFLVDGIVEDLITEFSMISEIEIVSRPTCFNLRDENLSHQ